MQPELIVSIVSVALAALSPIILTILNQRHELKMKSTESVSSIRQATEIEIQKSKLESFKKLYLITGEFISSLDSSQEDSAYGKLLSSISEASLYCSDDTMILLDRFNTSASELYASKSAKIFEIFISNLNDLRLSLRDELHIHPEI